MGLVRLFLAAVVAADHWWVIMLVPRGIGPDDTYKLGFNAGYAVMFFYVISGFLITYTLSRNYRADTSGALAFYRNRLIRIFSLYWPMVGLSFVLIAGAWARFVGADGWDKFTGLFLIGMDWRLSFATYPAIHWEAAIGGLHQAWTLGAELLFYLMAPLLMRSWLLGAALLVLSFGLRAWFVSRFGADLQDIWTYHFVGATFGFFMLGHLVCLASRRWRRLTDSGLSFAFLIAAIVVMGYATSYAAYDTKRFWFSAVCFSLALPGLFEATKNMRWMNRLGDLSYPLYLVHTAVVILAGPWLADWALSLAGVAPRQGAYLSVFVFVALSTLAAFGVHRLLEMPAAWAMRTALKGPAPRRASAE